MRRAVSSVSWRGSVEWRLLRRLPNVNSFSDGMVRGGFLTATITHPTPCRRRRSLSVGLGAVGGWQMLTDPACRLGLTIGATNMHLASVAERRYTIEAQVLPCRRRMMLTDFWLRIWNVLKNR